MIVKSAKYFIALYLFLGYTVASQSELSDHDPPIVKTNQGSLEGLTLKSRNGQPYYAFLGVPYAEYPGRFEVATVHASWDGVRPAKKYGSICAQIDLLKMDRVEFTGEEMCLFLNIYTPTLDKNAQLPVLFWIHGGGYTSWSGNDFDGKYFVDENVIVVSINYRLGPLGFLSFGDENDSMANIGLKDQLLALKFVKQNIEAFGGDASKVTIAGYSAGASSVHLHMLSKQSTGLFRAAISQSGTALAFWAVQQNPRENAVKLASFLECPVPETQHSSSKDTLACLKSKTAKEIVVAQMKLKEWLAYPVVIFGPVIESKRDDSFISERPEFLLSEGNYNKVNWIAGLTEDEGALFDVPLILNTTLTETLENEWEEKAPILLGYQHLPTFQRDHISKIIRNHYFDNYEIEEMTWSSLRNMLTDRYFLEPLVASLELQSRQKDGKLFPYIFRFSGDFSVLHVMYGLEGDQGISHGDDLQYLFPGAGGFGSPDYSGDAPWQIIEFSKKFVQLWANFVKETIPSKTSDDKEMWKSYSNSGEKEKSPEFYEIAIEAGVWDENISKRMKVWNEALPTQILPEKSAESKTEL